MWLGMLAMALAIPSPREARDALENGKYELVSSDDDAVEMTVDLFRVVGDDCERGGVSSTWCVVPKLTLRNTGDAMLEVDPAGISSSWSADGSMRALFPVGHSYNFRTGWAPVLIPPGQRWSAPLVRQNPVLRASLSRTELRGGASLIEPGNELVVSVARTYGPEQGWSTARFRLDYVPPEAAPIPPLASGSPRTEYEFVRSRRNAMRGLWITSLSFAALSGAATVASIAGDGNGVGTGTVVTVGFLGVSGALFAADRQLTRRLDALPAPTVTAEGVATPQ